MPSPVLDPVLQVQVGGMDPAQALLADFIHSGLNDQPFEDEDDDLNTDGGTDTPGERNEYEQEELRVEGSDLLPDEQPLAVASRGSSSSFTQVADVVREIKRIKTFRKESEADLALFASVSNLAFIY